MWIVKLRLSRGLFNTRVRGSGFTHTVYNATVCGEFHTQIAHYNAHTLDGIKGVSLWPFLMCILNLFDLIEFIFNNKGLSSTLFFLLPLLQYYSITTPMSNTQLLRFLS